MRADPANRPRTVERRRRGGRPRGGLPGRRADRGQLLDRPAHAGAAATPPPALAALLRELPQRPVHARAAKDNAASLAVLRKCGFVVVGEDSGYANGRGDEVEEWLLELPADPR